MKSFKVTQDKAGKYWIWCEDVNQNLAIRQDTLEKAYMAAMESLLFSCKLYKKDRDTLRVGMNKVESLFTDLFERESELN